LRSDVGAVRKKIADAQFETNEKVAKFTDNQHILSENALPPDQLAKLDSKLTSLRATILEMESRLVNGRDRVKEDKLAIFRQQVVLIANKKNELADEIKSLNEERTQTEIQINSKRKDIVRLLGKPTRPQLHRQNRHSPLSGRIERQNHFSEQEAV
jgi:hypothetical protein